MNKKPIRVVNIGISLCMTALLFASNVAWSDSRKDIKNELSKPMVRGGIVFKNYCKLCHGEKADGMARAAKLYGVTNLTITPGSNDYYFKVIRSGGESVGKSEFMPPWEGELSEEQINDVVTYLQIVTDKARRGEVVFKTNCILCHGINANGKGRAAKLYTPPPTNLTKSDKSDDYKISIITLGGKAMGRSEFMPPWGDQLTEQEIVDAVAYLKTISNHD
jgi:cbb3-type cytochrome c oxidase subunit III